MQIKDKHNNNKDNTLSPKERKDRAKRVWLLAANSVIDEYGTKTADTFQTKSSERSGYTQLFDECLSIHQSTNDMRTLQEEFSSLKDEISNTTKEINESLSKSDYYTKGWSAKPDALSMSMSLLKIIEQDAIIKRKASTAKRSMLEAQSHLKAKGVAKSDLLIKQNKDDNIIIDNQNRPNPTSSLYDHSSSLAEDDYRFDNNTINSNETKQSLRGFLSKAVDKISGFDELHDIRVKSFDDLNKYKNDRKNNEIKRLEIEKSLEDLSDKWQILHNVALSNESLSLLDNKKVLSMLEKRSHIIEDKLESLYKQSYQSLSTLAQNEKFNKRVIQKIKENNYISKNDHSPLFFLIGAQFEKISDAFMQISVDSFSQKEINSNSLDALATSKVS